MNTIGKILVILVFLASVVTGGFLVIDFAARTDWKRYALDLEKELKVANSTYKSGTGTVTDLVNKLKQKEIEVEAAKQKIADLDASGKATEVTLLAQIEEYKLKLKDGDVSREIAVKEQDRLKRESQQLQKVIEERQVAIVKLQEEVKTYRTSTVFYQNQNNVLNQRLENLQARVVEFEQSARTKEVGTVNAVLLQNQSNPPANKVTGQVKTVSGDLVELSVGSDDGLQKGHTLELFRTSPDVKYLGSVRITQVYPRHAVARLMSSGQVVRAGDQVASQLK